MPVPEIQASAQSHSGKKWDDQIKAPKRCKSPGNSIVEYEICLATWEILIRWSIPCLSCYHAYCDWLLSKNKIYSFVENLWNYLNSRTSPFLSEYIEDLVLESSCHKSSGKFTKMRIRIDKWLYRSIQNLTGYGGSKEQSKTMPTHSLGMYYKHRGLQFISAAVIAFNIIFLA